VDPVDPVWPSPRALALERGTLWFTWLARSLLNGGHHTLKGSSMKLAVLGLASLSLAASACINERVYTDPNANIGFGGGGEYYEQGNINVEQARVRGDIGPIRQFDDPAATGYGYDDREFGTSQVTLNAVSSAGNGTGLVMLYLDRSLQDLPVGRTVLEGANDDFTGNYVQLCSDRTDGSVHFDGIAESVVIDITEQGNVRDVNVEATITEGFEGADYANPEPTVVTSEFRVSPSN
jgi:hypothetical protein